MKHNQLLPICLFLLACAGALPAQSCLPNGITFSSQTQVDQFRAMYPGCTSIAGDVFVRPLGITNLDSLIGLKSIGGDFFIDAGLTSLHGLDSLESIGGSFWLLATNVQNLSGLNKLRSIQGDQIKIEDNQQLNSLQGLESLSAPPNFYLLNNNALTTLTGLEGLTSTTGDLEIRYNENLGNLDALVNLDSVGGNFRLDQSPQITDLLDLSNVSYWGGGIQIYGMDGLTNLQGITYPDSVFGDLTVAYSFQINDISAVEPVRYIGGNLEIIGIQDLLSIAALHNTTYVGSSINVDYNFTLQNLNGLENIAYLGGGLSIVGNQLVPDLNPLPVIRHLAGTLDIGNNPALSSLSGLDSLETVAGNLRVSSNGFGMHDLKPLSSLRSVGGEVFITQNNGLFSLLGLEKLTTVGGDCFVNGLFSSYEGLNNLRTVGGNVDILQNSNLNSLHGLDSLQSIGGLLAIIGNNNLHNLQGLNQLDSVGDRLFIRQNFQLGSLSGLDNLQHVGGIIEVVNNQILSDCAIDIVCGFVNYEPDSITISGNAGGCNEPGEIPFSCKRTPVIVSVQLDADGDCLPDAQPLPATGAGVRLRTPIQNTGLHPVNAQGEARFVYYNNGPFTLDLPQLSPEIWSVCPDSVVVTPALVSDTLRAAFLLSPVLPCPDVVVQLGLPASFRGCLVSSQVQVSGTNTGPITAEDVRLAVVIPPVFEILASSVQADAQVGDTLFFDLGSLQPFASAAITMEVKTRCDTFLLGQTLCWEAFANVANACPKTGAPASEIRLSARCVGDSLVRFTLRNIGDAPTQAPHQYTLYQNDIGLSSTPFSLNAQGAFDVDLPADGATYRMEATKFNDGTLTAAALENCAGLTPGWINAFWLDKGPRAYDLDCRIVNAAYDPNAKSAVPGGQGWPYLLPPNRPLLYTIDFQNTGTDTAYRVQLSDDLPFGLDIGSFQPVASSHPCTWDIRGGRLTVLYQPIALPDSNVNEPASRGFFSFEINQIPDLPIGSELENTAAIVFDFNPPVITNTVRHSIGILTVEINEPITQLQRWQVLGNPTRETAVLLTPDKKPGSFQFELYDALGRQVRRAEFSDSQFEFKRNGLAAGCYTFRVWAAEGAYGSGKIMIVD